MKGGLWIAGLLAAGVASFAPGALADSDPVASVNADLAALGVAVGAAHDTLVADSAKISADAAALSGSTDRAAIKSALAADVKTFRADRASLLGAVRAARAQLQTDLKAAKAASSGQALKPLVQAARTKNKAALVEIRQAARQARAAVKALRQSLKTN